MAPKVSVEGPDALLRCCWDCRNGGVGPGPFTNTYFPSIAVGFGAARTPNDPGCPSFREP